jgi:hypothetical protein
MNKKKTRDDEWALAIQRCRLSAEDVRKAKELGLTPRSLMGNIPSPSQAWKSPVNVWVRELYEKLQEKRAAKARRRAAAATTASPDDGPGEPA